MPKQRRIYALLAAITMLAGMLLSCSTEDDLQALPPVANFMDRQARALQSAYESDLDALDQAPRYTITASIDPINNQVAGDVTVRYTNRSTAPLETLVFRLYPNAKTIYGGGRITVDRVVEGEEVLSPTFSQRGTIMHVPLAAPLEPGAATIVKVTFSAQVPASAAQGYGIFAHLRGLLSLAGWYPILAPYQAGAWQTPEVPVVGDAMLAETSLYDVALTLPAGYEVVSTGVVLDQQSGEDETTWHIVSGPAREFAVVVSDQITTLQRTIGGVTLRVHTLPADGAVTSPRNSLSMATDIFQVYTEHYGAYRLTELDIVHAVVPIGGYEFPGMVHVEAAKRTGASRADYEFLLAHELAHQWWYAQAGTHTVNEPWLDEGMANYSVVLYREEGNATSSGAALLDHWRSTYGTRRPHDPPIDSAALDFTGWPGYRQTVYIHSALFLDALRQAMGDAAYFEFLRQFLAAHRYELVSTEDFLQMAQSATEEDLTPLFETWFGG